MTPSWFDHSFSKLHGQIQKRSLLTQSIALTTKLSSSFNYAGQEYRACKCYPPFLEQAAPPLVVQGRNTGPANATLSEAGSLLENGQFWRLCCVMCHFTRWAPHPDTLERLSWWKWGHLQTLYYVKIIPSANKRLLWKLDTLFLVSKCPHLFSSRPHI